MEIVQEQHGDVWVFLIKGKLDSLSSKALEDQMATTLAQGPKKILADFTQLDYISSAGLRVLLMTAKKLSGSNGSIALCALKPSIKTVFDIAGFSAVFQIFPTPSEALTHLAGK